MRALLPACDPVYELARDRALEGRRSGPEALELSLGTAVVE